jgi:cobalt-zinc-cadmium efflux system protein
LHQRAVPDHTHSTGDASRLGRALAITAAFMLVEVAGGLLSGSLALLADAGHMLTDSAALTLAWVAARYAGDSGAANGTRPDRGQALAALVNALALVGVAVWLMWEAVQRLVEPRDIAAGTMLAVALLGLVANVAVLRVLGAGQGATLNLAAARLHVISDLLGSIAASVAAVVILATGWTPVDPLLSMFVAVLIVRSALGLLLASSRALLGGPPSPAGRIDAGAEPPP